MIAFEIKKVCNPFIHSFTLIIILIILILKILILNINILNIIILIIILIIKKDIDLTMP